MLPSSISGVRPGPSSARTLTLTATLCALLGPLGCVGSDEPLIRCEEASECGPNAECTFRICACDEGFRLTEDGCVDIDECLSNPCETGVSCTNLEGSFECGCGPGFEADGTTCVDIDECNVGTDNCAPEATCTNAIGSFQCACASGFEGDGVTCQDVDECSAGTAGCAMDATCTNTPGAFSCTCNPGFAGDGQSCSDIDECDTGTSDCDMNATCTNEVGSFTCACLAGFQGNGRTCTDIDECTAMPAACDVNATCANLPGTFECDCNAGWMGDGQTCTDIDECAQAPAVCDANAACANAPGSFQCTCNAGWRGNGQTCADIDECADGTDNCAPVGSTCDNVPGSFMCSCAPGFTGNGVTCDDVDECAAGTSNCDPRALCTNSPGSFNCQCDTGYTGTGQVCTPLFDVAIDFTSAPSPAARAAFESAEARWEDLIVADLPDIPVNANLRQTCGIPAGINTIDDLIIVANIQAIDGSGGILGQAGPRCVRQGSRLPFIGVMTFDSADVADLVAAGRFEAVVLHEMGHVLGIGSLWRSNNLLQNPSCPNGGAANGADTRYTGTQGVAAWQSLGGTGDVPVENERGQGSCDGHWRERGTLERELMSPALSATNFLSIISMRSLVDLGYTVGPNSRADTFSLAPLVAPGPAPIPVDMGNDLDTGPVYQLEPDGSLRRVR